MTRRLLLRVIGAVVAVFLLVVAISATQYVRAHPRDPLQQNLASWARENNMGPVVDKLEAWLHNDPPAVAPADSLALAITPITDPTPQTSTTVTASPSESSTSTTVPDIITPLQIRPTVATSSCPVDNTVATVVTSTTTTSSTTTTVPVPGTSTTTSSTTIPAKPADIQSQLLPALPGEGTWQAIMRVRTKPIVYATSIRPLWCFGSVVATMATFDPIRVHTAMFNGTEMPGGTGWKNGSKIRGSALRSLIASFNGGFRFEHQPGGYVTEGKTVRTMRKGYATLAISADGTSTVGVWGDTITDDGSWASLRQNLPPLVHNRKSVYANYPKVDWGQDFGNKVYNFRSAICLRTDGLMMFVAVGKVNIGMLADTLVVLGCQTGMELDINGEWPYFAVYNDFGKATRRGAVIDNRMGDPNRHLNGSTKEFFALFDPETLPAGAVK
ncbi:MAG: phosphodiester glycosidase family protein [Ilumatobacteraceae bacterium]